MNKHIIYVGLFDKDTKKQEITKRVAKKIIANSFGDCTISDATGVYTHHDKSVVTEPSLRVEVFGIEKSTVLDMIKDVKAKLNQESVAYEYSENVDSVFV